MSYIENEIKTLKAWLGTIFVLLVIHVEDLPIPHWVATLPLVLRYLFEFLTAFSEGIAHANARKSRISYTNSTPIHWNPKTKSMYEDIEIDSDDYGACN